jgi:hypothetical protein
MLFTLPDQDRKLLACDAGSAAMAGVPAGLPACRPVFVWLTTSVLA